MTTHLDALQREHDRLAARHDLIPTADPRLDAIEERLSTLDYQIALAQARAERDLDGTA